MLDRSADVGGRRLDGGRLSGSSRQWGGARLRGGGGLTRSKLESYRTTTTALDSTPAVDSTARSWSWLVAIVAVSGNMAGVTALSLMSVRCTCGVLENLVEGCG